MPHLPMLAQFLGASALVGVSCRHWYLRGQERGYWRGLRARQSWEGQVNPDPQSVVGQISSRPISWNGEEEPLC